MAGTVCDFKSFLANFSLQSVETIASGVAMPEPHSSTPTGSNSQASAALIPKVIEAAVRELVANAWNLHSSSNGATVSLRDGNMTGQKLFAVSVYPERTAEFRNPPTWKDVAAFVVLNLNLLLRPSHAFGSWFDEPKHTHVVDVVVCLPDRRTALELGRKFKQVSIFDLENFQEITIERS